MKKLAEMIGKLVVVLMVRGVITEDDKKFLLNEISEAEWIDREVESKNDN